MPQITERGLGQMIHYVCKYTPVELLNAFGEECAVLEEMPENFEMSDQIAHANLCGFGKSDDSGSSGRKGQAACTCELL